MTKQELLSLIKSANRALVIYSLEGLVNSGRITEQQAKQVWAAAFGGRLVVMPQGRW